MALVPTLLVMMMIVFLKDTATLAVGQAAVVEHLQQDVEDVGVGLLHLVEQDHGVRTRRTASVSWPPSS